MTRRRFIFLLQQLGVSAAVTETLYPFAIARAATPADTPAKYWHTTSGGVECELCPRNETLASGEVGSCHVRANRRGKLVTLGYDHPCVLNIDPIEKNPLAHVLPGAELLAIAHAGCNIHCPYCQNWQFSQKGPDQTRNIADFDRAAVIAKAAQRKLKGLAFTYTEPSVTPEFLAAAAQSAADKGLLLTLCSCGYIQDKPLRDIVKPFAAVTITYKGATEQFYHDVCGASLAPVLNSMVAVKSLGKWLEVATLIVPTLNDDTKLLASMARWIVKNLGPDTPWHLERFNPQHELANLPMTPQATLETTRKIGFDAGLKFVYISNLAPHEGNHTYCPHCHAAVITRLGFKIIRNDLTDGTCPNCRTKLPGIWT